MPRLISASYATHGAKYAGGQTKLARVTGEILPDNRGMRRVCDKLGFRLEQSIDEPTVRAVIDLTN